SRCGDDRLIPPIVWQNLHPLLEDQVGAFLAEVKRRTSTANLGVIMPRVVERILARRKAEPALLLDLFALMIEGRTADESAARQTLALLAAKVQTGEISGEQSAALKERFAPLLRKLLAQRPASPLRLDAAL